MEEDARRRDFTMNALYADRRGVVFDPVGGLPDLHAGHVRFIDDPAARIQEDYLRILRFFRFSTWYGDPAAGMDAEALAALLNLIAVFHDDSRFEPRLDFAIRGWAHHSAQAAARVHDADEVRLGAIRAMFLRFGFAEDEADVRARTVYLTQIGYIAMQVTEDTETRMSRVAAYVKTFCGEAPGAQEMTRFRAGLEAAWANSGPTKSRS